MVLLMVVTGSHCAAASPPQADPLPWSASDLIGWSPQRGLLEADWLFDDGRLRLGGGEHGTLEAALMRTPFHGQFDVSIGLESFTGRPAGLILVESRDGQPDPGNWVVIERFEHKGRRAVRVRGMRDGQPLRISSPYLQEIQNGAAVDPLRELLAEGVIVLRDDTPRLRVLRNTVGGLIHLQFADHRVVDGQMTQGWSELPTTSDREGASYFLGVFAAGGSDGDPVSFHTPESRPMPLEDVDDSAEPFGAKRRGYTWGGYHGDAVVINFDQRADRPDAKFVFWSEANYIPWWHLNDRVALTYEFVEIWGGDTVGCNEPMSDHLLRWTRAHIVEANAARVVVQWDYTLITSDYAWWNNHPTIRPTVRETFTFYPDGVGVRKVTYRPPLEEHETHHKWGHELGELIAIFAGGQRTHEFLPPQALSVFDLDTTRHDYTWAFSQPTGNPWKHRAEEWPAVILQSRFQGGLASPYIAFAQDESARASTAPVLPIQYGSDWELNARPGDDDFTDPKTGRRDFGGFSHWPIMKQPYDSRSWIGATALREPRHHPLIAILSGPGGFEWPVGPKQRTYAMLVGLGGEDAKPIQDRVRSWINPGRVEVITDGFESVGNDFYERAIRVRNTSSSNREPLRLKFTPESLWINPVLVIDGWTPKPALGVTIGGIALDPGQYEVDSEHGRTVIWIHHTLDQPVDIELKPTD